MQLSTASRFAIRGLVHLSRHPEQPIPTLPIAEAQSVPERFLRKAFAALVEAGILETPWGPEAGYQLARPAAEITLLQVVDIIESITPASAATATTAELRQQLARVRIADLARGIVYEVPA